MVWLYGIAGFSVLNETLRVNFVPAASSLQHHVPGETLGAGPFLPNFLLGFGAPVSLFVEYQHTWWSTRLSARPPPRRLFNFNFAPPGPLSSNSASPSGSAGRRRLPPRRCIRSRPRC